MNIRDTEQSQEFQDCRPVVSYNFVFVYVLKTLCCEQSGKTNTVDISLVPRVVWLRM